MTPEEREALKQEIRAEIMAEVHTAIWAAIGVHVNGPSPTVAAPIGAPWATTHPFPVIVGASCFPGPHVNTSAAAPTPIQPWRQVP